ncbi:MAG: hypothetical protein HY291_24200 [Planctomycetes bacterium]|nr:hypothetical protein [Planctomycetota bacterium]
MKEPAPSIQPVYAWWPWRFLTLGVPFVAGATAYVIVELDLAPSGGPFEFAKLAFLSIFAAGDALILGMATGHLGKTLLAMIAGMAVSAAAFKGTGEYGEALSPLVALMVIFACLDRDYTVKSILSTVIVGISCFGRGLSMGVILALALWIMLRASNNSGTPYFPILIVATCALMGANEVFIRKAFLFVQRAEGNPQAGPPAEANPEKPETMAELLNVKRHATDRGPQDSEEAGSEKP